MEGTAGTNSSFGAFADLARSKRTRPIFAGALSPVLQTWTLSAENRIVQRHGASPISRNSCRFDDITTPGLRWTVGGKGTLLVKMVGHEPNRDLPLAVWLLVDGSRIVPFLKVRRHFREKVRGDHLCLPCESPRSQGAAHGKTIDGVHVDSGKSRQRPSRSNVFWKLSSSSSCPSMTLTISPPGQCRGNASENPSVFLR